MEQKELYSVLDSLTFPVVILDNLNVRYLNEKAKEIIKTEEEQFDFSLFIDESQKNFLISQLTQIKKGESISFSLILKTQEQDVPVLVTARLIENIDQKYRYFLVFQTIQNQDVVDSILNNIILETFTLHGEELIQTLLKKIVEAFDFNGSFLLLKEQIQEYMKSHIVFQYEKSNQKIEINLTKNFIKKLDLSGFILIEKDFNQIYPSEKIGDYALQALIGIKTQLTEQETLYLIAYSEKIQKNLPKIHFALNILNLKIINDYMRLYFYKKYENIYKIFLQTSDAVFIYNVEKNVIIDCNNAFLRLLNTSKDKIVNQSPFAYVDEVQINRFRKIFEYYYRKKRLKNNRLRVVFKNSEGAEIPLEVSITIIQMPDGTNLIGVVRDLSYVLKAIEHQKNYSQVLNFLKLHVVELDRNLQVISFNNYSNSSDIRLKVNDNFLEIVQQDYQEYVRMMINNLFIDKKSIRIRFPIMLKAKKEWYDGDFFVVRKNKKKIIKGILKNITLEYLTEKQFILISEYDLLTSLPNRIRLEEDLYKAILRADRNRSLLAVGFLNLDKFFHVNELLGHRLGDLLISLFAERLRLFPELKNNIYRWGGDQFVFFIEDIYDKQALYPIIERLKQIAKEPFFIEGEKFFLTFSIGIAIYPSDGLTIDVLFGEADKALHHAKQSGRYQVVFASNLPKRSFPISRFELQSYILESISEEKIYSYFQPIYDIFIMRIIGVEVLARLRHFQNEIYIGPDIFIPIAEDLGLIEELSLYVIKKSMEFYKKIRKFTPLYISFNISRRLLQSDYFVMSLFDIQRFVGVEAKDIVIEITESLAMFDKENSITKLGQLKKIGYRIAIDDFGTGYSSLSELRDFPLDIIKIDKTFIKKIHLEEQKRIVEAIVSIANSLNLEVVAEGLEDLNTLELLKNLGIRYAQGYFFSPPLPEKELEKTLKRINNIDV
ncbi:MAG: EAL domain-containing protein [Leptospiraceae bacterium]|nr:EAL domain-containing protein [Leptospiraceae bacterium]MDW7976889.1 EAL domain-containing protein [Leptospiraceae bacterium]